MVSLSRGTSAEDGLATRHEANQPPLEWTAGPLEEKRDYLAGALGLPQKQGGTNPLHQEQTTQHLG